MSTEDSTQPGPTPASPPPRSSAGASARIAAGMLFSRLSGFARSYFQARYLGVQGDAAGVFTAAFRIPNFLQNLLGDGTLAASLVPTYTKLLTAHERDRADEMARAVLAVLALLLAGLVVIGIYNVDILVTLAAPGFKGEQRELAEQMVRILFPGIAVLVLSAWCLAILNSHRRFFISYLAPVAWNIAMIVALLTGDKSDPNALAVRFAWGALIGSFLQLGVQLPGVFAVMTKTPAAAWLRWSADVKKVLALAMPATLTRGVVQISTYIDSMIASWISAAAVAALGYGQQIYTLPISLLGMAVSSAELPEMARSAVRDGSFAGLKDRLASARDMLVVGIVPCVVVLLFFGRHTVALLYEHGRFTASDSIYVWSILAGSAVGLLASTLARVWTSAFFALGDSRTPLVAAIVRVTLVGGLGYVFALPGPRWLGIDPSWGAAGLTASAGIAGWVEFSILRGLLAERIGPVPGNGALLSRVWLSGLGAAVPAGAVEFLFPANTLLKHLTVLVVFTLAYVGLSPDARALGLTFVDKFRRRAAR